VKYQRDDVRVVYSINYISQTVEGLVYAIRVHFSLQKSKQPFLVGRNFTGGENNYFCDIPEHGCLE